jgi:L-cysteine desulfidase
MLKWMIGDRRVRLDVKKLEGMSKIRSYHLASIKNELLYYGKDLSSGELREIVNISAVGNIISLNDEDDDITNNILLEERREMEIQTRTNLVLEDFIDLAQSFDNMETVDLGNNDNVDERNGNMDFEPIALVNEVLETNQ